MFTFVTKSIVYLEHRQQVTGSECPWNFRQFSQARMFSKLCLLHLKSMHSSINLNCWFRQIFVKMGMCLEFVHSAQVKIYGSNKTNPSPGSSVGSNVGCQSRGCEFESQLGQHSFRRLTKVIVTCVIHCSPMGCLTIYVEKQPVAWKVCCVVYWCGKTRKHMSRWTGHSDMTKKNWKQR